MAVRIFKSNLGFPLTRQPTHRRCPRRVESPSQKVEHLLAPREEMISGERKILMKRPAHLLLRVLLFRAGPSGTRCTLPLWQLGLLAKWRNSNPRLFQQTPV